MSECIIAFDDNKDREKAEYSIKNDAHDHLTICEVIRFIYDDIYDLPEDKRNKITAHLVDAFIMGKKMVQRLDYYKRHYPEDSTGNKGKNIRYLEDTRQRKEYRRSRI